MDVNLCVVNSKWRLSDKKTTHLLESNWYLSAYVPEQHRSIETHFSLTKYHTLKLHNITPSNSLP